MDPQMRRLVAAMQGEAGRHAANAGFYEDLAAGQAPAALVICCADSRAAPEPIMQAAPGTLFVERSVAGLVPPPPGRVERSWLAAYGWATRLMGMRQLAGAWYGPWAAIEYPVVRLNVPNILVLGHSGCGGVALACRRRGSDPSLRDTDRWVDMVRPALKAARRGDGAAVAGNRSAEEAAIRWSRSNLLRHAGIARRVADGRTAVHAAYYDIATGRIAFFDAAKDAFVPLAAAG
jgi:carbonic anhydrase